MVAPPSPHHAASRRSERPRRRWWHTPPVPALRTDQPDPGPGLDDGVVLPTDGRRARAVRTRETIADALLSLLEEGDLRPTAGRIAERAGISERLIYHHFAELDALMGTVATRQIARAQARRTPLDPSASLAARVRDICADRADLHEWTTPIRRASQLQEPSSTTLAAARRQVNETLRAEVETQFAAELDRLGRAGRRELLAALDVTLSWPVWYSLRTVEDLDVPSARRTLVRMVRSLVAAP